MATSGDLLGQAGSRSERRLVDRLRALGLDKYVELPQIAVMGDTSSGKSSLLSALSGVTFPSSDKLTTRCPTQLILSHDDHFRGSVRLVRFNSAAKEDERELESMEDVAGAIEALTSKLVSEGQYISDDQIVIELSGPELPNLTLTDLPGLVRTVADGEDPGMITRVQQLVGRFMDQERTVIIAVVPANVDVHNTGILQAAEEADPSGNRTIAVVTKLDLVDEGAESSVHELLLNKKKFMKLGYHAVKCRSQKELNQKVSIAEGAAREASFFPQHEFWRRLPPALWGVPALTTKLVKILHDNICRSLPTVVEEIDARVAAAEKELEALGAPLDSASARREAFGRWMNAYLRQMEAAVRGVRSDSVLLLEGNEDAGIERLRAVLREKEREFQEKVELTRECGVGKLAKPKKDVAKGDPVLVKCDDGKWHETSVEKVTMQGVVVEIVCRSTNDAKMLAMWQYNSRPEIERHILANRGDELQLFASYQVFRGLFRQWVAMWEAPTMELLKNYRLQTKVASERAVGALSAAPRVSNYFHSTATSVLRRIAATAEREMKSLLRSEGRPYTQSKALFAERDRRRERLLAKLASSSYDSTKASAVSSEAIETEVALYAYLEVATCRFVDVVPMRLNDLVLGAFLAGMEAELVATTDEQLERLLCDSGCSRDRREQLVREVQTLQDAKDEIELVY